MDFTGQIINRRKPIIAVVLLLAAVCSLLFIALPINYNMTDYLPAEANSTLALEVMEAEFDQPIPNTNVMLRDVSVREASDMKTQLEALDPVVEVLWLDDYAVDLSQPLETQDPSLVETYYKDGNALFTVTVADGRETEGMDAIRALIGEEGCISGTASEMAQSQGLASSESGKALALLLPMILIVLFLTTTSWVEPILYLLAIGAAVLINLGTDFFRGEISFVTLAVAPILQIAVSIDYAVFLSHSFNDHRMQGMGVNEAMRCAIKKSGKAIAASMLTTLFGFIALMFMNFRIGPDMAVSLIKGVLLSFGSVLVFLPALILCSHKWIEKTRHKRILPTFEGIGKHVLKIRFPVLGLIIAVMIPCFLAQSSNEFFYGSGEMFSQDSDVLAIEQEFGKSNQMVLLVPRGDTPSEIRLCEDLEAIPQVKSVLGYVNSVGAGIPAGFLDPAISGQFYSDNYARIILNLDMEYEGDEAFSVVEQIRAAAGQYYDHSLTCGQSANLYDMKLCVERDSAVVDTLTLLFIYLILMFTFRSWLTPIPLVLVIRCSIWINMSLPYFQGDLLCYIGYVIVSAVQMGATVDYAIILTDHYTENRKLMEPKEAMRRALGKVFGSILVSAIIMSLCGFCLSAISSNVIVAALGSMIGFGTVFSLCLVVLLLPTLLLLLDRFLPWTRLKLPTPGQAQTERRLEGHGTEE